MLNRIVYSVCYNHGQQKYLSINLELHVVGKLVGNVEGHLPGGSADAELSAGNLRGLLVEELLDELRQVLLDEVVADSGEGGLVAELTELLNDLLLGVIRLDVVLSEADQELADLALLGTWKIIDC